jgi:hypothetical protein
MKFFPVTGSKIADVVILVFVGYIIYGLVFFGLPSSDPVAPADPSIESPYDFDVMDLF